MRKIKFRRAYFTDAGKFSHFSTWGVKIGDAAFVGPATNNFAESFVDQQFTGLLDRHDKEIYEGDVFDCVYKSDGCAHKSVVVFEAPRFRLTYIGECQQTGVYQSISDGARYGVIGNIYENPELLETKAEAA